MSRTVPTRSRLPGLIWILGVVSLCMDTSSELVHALLPIYMTTVLGAGMVTVGVIEGVAEATASIVKVFSGSLSDAVGSRKWLVVAGYGLAALTKPVFPLAASVSWVFGARFVDRVGKGIRGAPRDALVADVVPAHMRGAAYGLRQSMDSIGAFLGPLLALLAMGWFAGDIRAVLWLATVPATLAVLLLVACVREPARVRGASTAAPRRPLSLAAARELPRRYWHIVALGVVFALARFSEAFLVLRAQDAGLPIAQVPAVMILMNVIYAGVAYPAGHAADTMSARTLLVAGLAVLVAADVALAVATAPWFVFVGTAAWGAHLGLSQGLFSKLVADTAPAHARGTAFGVFNLVNGMAMLLASVIAGLMWSAAGPGATFAVGGGFALVAIVGLLAATPSRRGDARPA
ncbi:MAG: MFS transporter [Acidobacteria bacterium]|nr:MFS transporter [Acidobacteriota bacterium]